MKTDSASSGPSSATTSAAATPIQPDKSPAESAKAVAKAGVGESAYLERQAQLAQQAIARTLSEAASSAGKVVDPRKWAQTNPWMTLGATLVAGFAAAAVVVPSKEQQALRKLAKIERALNPQPEPEHHRTDGDGAAAKKGKDGPPQSFGKMIVGELFSVLRPAIVSMLTAGITASAAKTSPEEVAAAAGNPPPSGDSGSV